MQEITIEQIEQLSIFDMYRVFLIGYEFQYTNERYYEAVNTYKFYFKIHDKIHKLTFSFGFNGEENELLFLEFKRQKQRIKKRKTDRSRDVYSKCDYVRENIEVDINVIYDILNHTERQEYETFEGKSIMDNDLNHVSQNIFAEHINSMISGGI